MMKKRITLIASTLVVTAFALTKLHPVTAYAVEGWMSEDGEWSYLDENDEPLQNTWRQSRDSWFYLGDQGLMLRNCFIDQRNSILALTVRHTEIPHLLLNGVWMAGATYLMKAAAC